jgi:SAM-dependent methyltransferase
MVGMTGDTVSWHDVECASYAADLPLWRELADGRAGPVLDLGCGTGRVALDLAGNGHRVVGLDSDAELIRELVHRARQRDLRVDAVAGDVRSFDLGRRFDLAIAPMQVAQLLGGADGRRRMLSCVGRHLKPGGLLGAALADPFEGVPVDSALPPMPDVREQDGWVLSSTPVAVRPEPGAVAVERVRQVVSPEGELAESLVTIRLENLDPDVLEREAAEAGFRPVGRRLVPETPDHVGSTVVLLEAA